jgi:hypothetical protein
MSQKNTGIIKDLILFYVKENYTNYLETHKIKMIQEKNIPDVVTKIYSERKPHLKEFLKKSLQEIMKDDYIGDLAVQTICNEIFADDEFCKNRIITEINLYQKKKLD